MNKIMKGAKIWMALALVVIVAGAFVLGFVGMNTTVSYGGGYEVIVTTDAELDTYETVSSITEKVLKDNGLKYEYKKEVNDKAILIYGFQSVVSAETVDAINAALQAESTLTNNPVAECNEVLATRSNTHIWMAVIVAAIVAVCAFVYALIRYKLAAGATIAVLFIVNVLLTVMLTAVCRVPVGEYYLASVAAIVLLGLMMNVFWLYAAKDIAKNVANEDKSVAERAVMAGNATAKLNLGLLIAVVVAAVLLAVLGTTSLAYVGYTMIAGIVSSAFVAIFLTGPVWSMFKGVGEARAKRASYQGKEKAEAKAE